MQKEYNLPKKVVAVDGFGSYSARPFSQRTLDSGMAFLVGQLEKLEPTLLQPLSSTTWARDIPVRTGGGFVESVASFSADYATTGGNVNGVYGRQTNDVPVMQADIGKDSYRVFNWAHILKVPFVEGQMMQKIGRSLDEMLDKGIHLAHDKALDQNVYEGMEEFGSYGLVNSPQITTTTAAEGASGETEWSTKTPEEILSDINNALIATWTASEYDVTGLANHILLPPEQYGYIRTAFVTTDASKSIYTYLMENNIAKDQGIELSIQPCRWCVGAGTGSSDRMVCYANAIDRVRFDQTVMLYRVTTQQDAKEMAYMSPYLSQFSEVQWLYTQHARYVDGI